MGEGHNDGGEAVGKDQGRRRRRGKRRRRRGKRRRRDLFGKNNMARRYDSRTTIFSPEGRLYQVEYAMEAISHSGAAVGMLAESGNAAVLAAEKRITSKLLDTARSSERLYQIDDHVGTAVAGITADANILINTCRLAAQRYMFQYQEPMPVEQLVQQICDQKQV